METWNWLVLNPRVMDIKQRDVSGVRDHSLTPDHPAQSFSARKISPHSLWL